MTDTKNETLHVATVAAIGMVVYLVRNVVHEGIGHGGVCILVGGEPLAISSAWWQGDYTDVSPWGQRWAKAGGTLANLLLNLPYRVLVVTTGIAVSAGTLLVAKRTVEPFLGTTVKERKRRIKILCWVPYFTAGVVFPVSAVFNPEGKIYMFTTALATLGGTAWLAWFLPFIVDKPNARSSDPPLGVPRSTGWIVAGAMAALFTVFVLGPSIVL